MTSMNTDNQQIVECIPINHFVYEAKLKYFSSCAFKQLKLIINRWPIKYFSSCAILQLINLLYPVAQLGNATDHIFSKSFSSCQTHLLPPFKFIGRFDFSRYKTFIMYLDILYIQVHNKIYVPTNSKTAYNLGQRVVLSQLQFGIRIKRTDMLAPMVGTVAWIASKSYYFQDKEWYDHQLIIIFHIRMQGMGQTRSDWKLWSPRKANNTG